jgi:hypothetical protein
LIPLKIWKLTNKKIVPFKKKPEKLEFLKKITEALNIMESQIPLYIVGFWTNSWKENEGAVWEKIDL